MRSILVFIYICSLTFCCCEQFNENASIMASKENKCISTLTNYGDDFISSIKINNIYGVQFHPEKSQKNGLTLIKNFIEKC